MYCTSEPQSGSSSSAPTQRAAAILLIQENVELRTALRKKLIDRGFDVLEAVNEQHAEVISTHVRRPIDIFITDRPDYEIARWHRIDFPAGAKESSTSADPAPIFVCATFAKPDLVGAVQDLARDLSKSYGSETYDPADPVDPA
jgi:response regulator RpfG family c-di-GMP phosphodiesterase